MAHTLFFGYEKGRICQTKNVYGILEKIYAKEIKIHNNVRVTSNVTFETYDGIHKMLNNVYLEESFPEKIGRIEIHDNILFGQTQKL